MKTLPDFLKRINNLKISFLHLDLDVYEPTKFVLNKLYNRVSKNGVILIDDYGQIKGKRLQKLSMTIQNSVH